eukprot:jgi/Ulvmu1/539/UM001_0547.1
MGGDDAVDGDDVEMGAEAARILDGLAGISIGVEGGAGGAGGKRWEEDVDARERRRTMMEDRVLACLKAAVAAPEAPAAAASLLMQFHEATGDFAAAKEAGFRWLRSVQAPGWHSEEEPVQQATACFTQLCRANKEMCQGLDEAARKRETATLRLQLSSSSKAVARALGDDSPLAAGLQRLLDELLEFLKS